MMTNNIPSGYKTSSLFIPSPEGMRRAIAVLFLILLTGVSVSSHSFSESEIIIQDNCRGCHGSDGKAKVESWPNLGCQNRGYLYSRLMSFKRDHDHDIDDRVKSLSITEIDEISRYYSTQMCQRP